MTNQPSIHAFQGPGASAEPDFIIAGGDVVTMNPSGDVFNGGAVAVAGEHIAEVGLADEITSRWPDADCIDAAGCVITPGFINAHQHFTGDPLIRSCIPDTVSSHEAIFQWAIPAHEAHTPDDEELSATLCAAEAALNGVTTVVEAGTVASPRRVAAGIKTVGIRAALSIWGSDADGVPQAAPPAEAVARQQEMLAEFPAGGLIEGWIALVGHDLASDELLQAAANAAKDAGVNMTMHISPTPADAESYIERTGKRPIAHFADLDILGNHLLLAHAVWLDDQELSLLLETQTAIAFCPWAYLRLGQGVTKAGRHQEFWQQNGRIALGADANNAGDSSDMLRVAALCAGLWRDQSMKPDSFGAQQALELLTISGAEAIGKAAEIGSLEAGKQADIAIHNTSGISWTPRGDIAMQLIWGSNGNVVRDVFVAGTQIVRDSKLTGIDLNHLRQEAAKAQKALLLRAGLAGSRKTLTVS